MEGNEDEKDVPERMSDERIRYYKGNTYVDPTTFERKSELYTISLSYGLLPVLCKGKHPLHNPEGNGDVAKQPLSSEWKKLGYVPPTLAEIELWEENGGWVAWALPPGMYKESPILAAW